jgi:hypothetical protein
LLIKDGEIGRLDVAQAYFVHFWIGCQAFGRSFWLQMIGEAERRSAA